MVIFNSYVSHYQRVYISYIHDITIPSLVIQCFSYDSSMFCWLLAIDPLTVTMKSEPDDFAQRDIRQGT